MKGVLRRSSKQPFLIHLLDRSLRFIGESSTLSSDPVNTQWSKSSRHPSKRELLSSHFISFLNICELWNLGCKALEGSPSRLNSYSKLARSSLDDARSLSKTTYISVLAEKLRYSFSTTSACWLRFDRSNSKLGFISILSIYLDRIT
jgi:hypothetical protein